MRIDTPPPAASDDEYAWFHEGSLPDSREDRIAEAVALIALLFSLGIGLLIALMPVAASAAEPAAPSLELAAFRIVPATPAHPEQRVAATEARAGDQLEYVATYHNPTPALLHHVMVTLPVPKTGVDYVLDTASPRADLASADGRQFAPLPLMRVVTTADGRRVTQPAPGADYRFLRWDLGDVPAGASRTVRTRVQLLATTVAAR
jgi:hypothetical protein